MVIWFVCSNLKDIFSRDVLGSNQFLCCQRSLFNMKNQDDSDLIQIFEQHEYKVLAEVSSAEK